MDAEPIRLLDPTGAAVDSELRFDLSLSEIAAAELAWGPHRRAAGVQHAHWNWVFKYGMPNPRTTQFIGIVCNGAMQGMAQLLVVGKSARLPPQAGDPLVFVEYVESAPWHLRDIAGHTRLRRVGGQLVRASIMASLRAGCGGRIGLHALGQAEGFYRNKCQMTDLGPDPGYNGMRYFEFTAADAVAFEQRTDI